MDVAGEVAKIVAMLVTLILGLLALGWTYGDFERPPRAESREPDTPKSSRS